MAGRGALEGLARCALPKHKVVLAWEWKGSFELVTGLSLSLGLRWRGCSVSGAVQAPVKMAE
ncbi:MAG: hypothetical protein CM1200mP41_15980 [Gammaproteobacteria bacterium]|nr:MAG: hypothetical protein CM1200mP41_15980 [Gammaproteobacteria bacterium]